MTDAPGFRPDDESVRILAAIVESSDDAIIAFDVAGVSFTWNGGAERMYGYTAAEAIGRSVSLLIPASHVAELEQNLDSIRRGLRVTPYETVRRTKDGRLIDVSLTIAPIRDGSGRIVGASATARDITARKQAELALRASEARWRAIVESAIDGIIVIDARGRIEAFNPAAERLFDYAEADVLGRNVNVLMPSPYREEHDEYIGRYLETNVPKIIGTGREVIGLRRDGTIFPLHLSVAEMSVAGERKFTGIVHDLSARVGLEERLREQTALARLGEMAAVIAHEVKNPLAAVRGAIQVIGRRMGEGSRDAPIVAEIISRIDSLNKLVQDLLLFARPPRPQTLPVEIAPLLTNTATLLAEDPELKNLHVEVSGAAPRVVGDPELLKIVFLNLFLNSAHAMEGRGKLRVAIDASGGACHVAIADSGPGIPLAAREKLFTPFFTTKSHGTGLGLATAKRIIEAHTGQINVQCPPEGGTTVTVQLPLV